MIYAVMFLTDEFQDLTDTIREVDPSAYTTYAPRAYFLRFDGPASSLNKIMDTKLAVSTWSENQFIVVEVGKNFGFAKGDLWNWIKEREQ